EDTRGDGDDADSVAGEVARHGEGHSRDGALGGAVGNLALVGLEGGAGCDEDDEAALVGRLAGVGLAAVLGRLAGGVNGAPDGAVHDEVKVVEAEGGAVPVGDLFVRTRGS